MDWYGMIKGFYNDGLWTKGQVWDAVYFEKLTPEQYEQITGDPYPSERPNP